MFDMSKTPASFSSKDVIGKQPEKVGDTFKAMFFGKVREFIVDEMNGSWFMGVLK